MSRARDERVLRALADGPLSVREIEARLRLEIWHAWADENGYEIEWGDPQRGRGPNEPVGARLAALAHAPAMGIEHISDARPLLLRLEREGRVARIQIPGHRPMLWRLA